MLGFFRALINYPFHLLKGIFHALAVVLLAFSTAALVAGYFGLGIGPNHDWANILDLFSNVRLLCLFIQLLSFALFLILQDKSWIVATVIALGVNLSDIVPYYLPQQKPFSAEAGALKILQWNVFTENRSPQGFIAYVREAKPDIIGLEEVDQLWLTQLNVPLRNYPYRVLVPQNNNFGIALYSKLPILTQQVRDFEKKPEEQVQQANAPFDLKHLDAKKIADGLWHQFFPQAQYPTIIATVKYRNQPINIIVTHPSPPISGFDIRNRQLSETAIFIGRLHQPTILMGDLNCSPWSVYYKAFLKNSGLKDSQNGFGLQPSWPNHLEGPKSTPFHKKIPALVAPFFQTPIDHVLLSSQFVVLKRQLGPPNTGSDHLPVFVEVAMNPTNGI